MNGEGAAVATLAWSDGAAADHATAAARMPLRQWLRTTPGILRLFSIVAVVGLLAVGICGVQALTQRRDATESLATGTGPQLTTTSDLYASLAAADAIASSALLQTSLETSELHARYQDELATAHRLLVDLTGGSELSPTAQEAARQIATELPSYGGRVALARANSRQGNPVGAAYMRAASAQVRDEILPAATTIWRDAATRLDHDVHQGTSTAWPAAFVITGLCTLLLLVGLSWFVARRTHRLVNIGLVAAAMLLVVAGSASLLVMAHQHSALVDGQSDGSDPLELLSAAHFLSLQGQADANLALAEQGTGQPYVAKFLAAADAVGGDDDHHGLIRDAQALAGGRGEIQALVSAFGHYRAVATAVRAEDDGGTHEEAVRLALDETPAGLAGAATQVNDGMEHSMEAFESTLGAAAQDARLGLGVAIVALAIALVAAAVAVVVGLQPRIGEYR